MANNSTKRKTGKSRSSSSENSKTEEIFERFHESLNHDQNQEVLDYIEAFCKDIYSAEVERENSILQQASNMQGAFSFVTAGLFVIAQIVTDNKGKNTPYWIIIASFVIITLLLILSLFFATRAQNRIIKEKGFPSIEDAVILATDNKEHVIKKQSRTFLTIQEYNGIYNSLRSVNEKRIWNINISMKFFYASIVSSILCAVVLIFSDWYFNIK